MNSMHENAIEILYPTTEVKATYYQNLSPDTLSLLNGLWEELKIESSGGEGVYICSLVIVVLLTVWFGYLFIRKKYRDNY